jgi:hypothetical protein
LEIGIPDLLWRISPHREAGVHIIPMMRGRIGPGVDAALTSIQGYIPMPAWRVQNLIDPIGARVGSDLVLPRELATHDLVLLDQNPNDRAAPGSGLWVVTEGAGLRVRYLSLEGTVLRVGNDATRDDTARWHSLQLQGRNILDLVRARIVWMGREMERAPAGPADQAGQGH